MKNFIKEYPKRIIIAALVVLLIAIVGTVNNYRTYSGYSNKPREITRSTFKYLEDIYGEGNIFYAEDVPTWYADKMHYRGVYYKAEDDKYIYLVGKGEERGSAPFCYMQTDKECYSKNDTVVAKINHYSASKKGILEFESDKYILEVVRNGIWYCVHTGEIGEDIAGELIELNEDECWEFSVDLSEVREVSDEPIRLKKGKYRLSKPATLKRAIPYGDGKEINRVVKIMVACEFEIK